VRAVALRVRSFFTGRWWATALTIVVVAVPAAVVLTLTAGAHRTATAADRYTRAVGGDADLLLFQTGGPPATEAVRALAGVRDVEAVTFVYARGPDDGAGAVMAGNGFGPIARLVRGRLPSPSAPHDFAATQSFLDAHHLRIGDHAAFTSFSQDQITSGQVSGEAAGPAIDGELVGVIGGSFELDDPTPTVLFPAALLHEPVGIVATPMMVRLEPGASADAVLQSLPALDAGDQFVVQSGQAVSASTRRAVSAQAAGLGILALVTALAVVAVIGQLLVRQLASRAAERHPLLALGYTGRQTAAEQMGCAAAIIVAGVVLGAVIAVFASSLFPRGFVRILDPRTGHILVEPLLLAAAASLIAVALLAWVGIGVLLARRAIGGERPSPTAEALARAGVSPSTVTGVRFALSRGRETMSAWATFGSLSLATATVLGAVVFSSSLGRLVDDPYRFGSNFDYLVDAGEMSFPQLSLDGAPGVVGATLMATSTAPVGGHDIDLIGVSPLRGALLPHVLDGRFPASADEVALGAVTARQLHADVGDSITFTSHTGAPLTFRVVGTAVMPSPNSFGNGGGYGAAMLLPGFQALDPDAPVNQLALQIAPGAAVPVSLAGFQVNPAVGMSKPPDVVNLSRSRSIPAALAVVVGLLGALTLAHALITSVRRRRHDFAVLRALGADRRWVGWSVHAQASTIAVVALAVGIPLGIVAGRIVFRLFVDQLGLVSDPSMPIVLIAVTSLAVVVVANLAAMVPGWRAARAPVAGLLRAE
jgi:ABC-type lipoprotein release transport system permease subunit